MRQATLTHQVDSSRAASGPLLQRQCACGNHTMGGKCEDCAKGDGQLQRRLGGGPESSEIPPLVHNVLRSPGEPLEAGVRSVLEPRLGAILGQSPVTPVAALPQRMAISQPGDAHEREADRVAEQVLNSPGGRQEPSRDLRCDLSRVRVHTDARAAESARAVNALAYTVGHHIVFGSGSYSPHSQQGLRLLAHELAHTRQQAPVLARKAASAPCLGPDVCKDVMFPSMLLNEAGKESKARRAKRERLCAKKPPDAGCRADRHGARAVETEELLGAYDSSRLPLVKGFFIDRDLEKDFRALTINCSTFTPPISPDGICITVPIETEEQAKTFNTTTGPLVIAGKDRDAWREKMIEILVHETEHARFRAAQIPVTSLAPGGVPTLLGKKRPTCSRNDDRQADVFLAMNELSAMLQEFPMRKAYIRSNVALSKVDRDAEMDAWREHHGWGARQSVLVSLRTARCLCGCDDANALIRETIEFATRSWTAQEKVELDLEMTHYRWSSKNLDWPSGPAAQKTVPDRPLPEGQEMA